MSVIVYNFSAYVFAASQQPAAITAVAVDPFGGGAARGLLDADAEALGADVESCGVPVERVLLAGYELPCGLFVDATVQMALTDLLAFDHGGEMWVRPLKASLGLGWRF